MIAKQKFFCLYVLSFFSFLVLTFSLPHDANANITLKVMSVNPSKDQSQKVSVKAYLPKETRPENVVNRADLDIAYDTQAGSYYVYGEFELKPGEVLEKDVELADIWTIPVSDIESLRQEAAKLNESLKGTEFAERASFLMNSVESKLNQVSESQKAPPANPERHISDYRENLKTLGSAKTDIALARSMLSQIKPFPAMMVWKMIGIIIIFLGVIGGAFYLVWQKQAKEIQQDTFYVPKEEKPTAEQQPKDGKGEDSPAPGPEKEKTSDIEKLMEEEDDLL